MPKILLFFVVLAALLAPPAGASDLGATVSQVERLSEEMILARQDPEKVRQLVARFAEVLEQAARLAEGASAEAAARVHQRLDRAVSDLRRVFPFDSTFDEAFNIHRKVIGHLTNRFHQGAITEQETAQRADFALQFFSSLGSKLRGYEGDVTPLGGGCLQSYFDCLQAADEYYQDCINLGIPWATCWETYLAIIDECGVTRDACTGG